MHRPRFLSPSRGHVESLLQKDVSKERLTEADRREALKRISITDKMTDLAEADFVIEVGGK